jgi:hypothetical protein
MTSIVAIVLNLALATGQDSGQVPASGPIPEAGHSTIGYRNVAEALEALRKKPGVTITESNGWIVVDESESGQSERALWSFSPSTYPAYPAVAKRTVHEKDGKVWIELAVECEATKEACDQMVREFQDLNERAMQSSGSGQ